MTVLLNKPSCKQFSFYHFNRYNVSPRIMLSVKQNIIKLVAILYPYCPCTLNIFFIKGSMPK